MPTEEQRANLLKLADYLDSLPVDYKNFDMSSYMDTERKGAEADYALHNGSVARCGTSACVVGHGPAAGMLVLDTEVYEEDDIDLYGEVAWLGYCERVFGISEREAAWSFLFSGVWAVYDNTISGAVKRMRYYLEKGIPDWWSSGIASRWDSGLFTRWLYEQEAQS